MYLAVKSEKKQGVNVSLYDINKKNHHNLMFHKDEKQNVPFDEDEGWHNVTIFANLRQSYSFRVVFVST